MLPVHVPDLAPFPPDPLATATPLTAWRDAEWPGAGVRPGGLLAACDGRPDTLPALRLAAGLAARDGCPVHVVAAVDGRPVFAPGFESGWSPADGPDVEARHRAVRNLVARSTGDPDAWTVQMLVGHPGPLLATVAAERGATLVLCGLGERRVRARLLGAEGVLRIIRHAPVPVLAVPAETTAIPRTAVVAMDFGDASVRAARAALSVLGDHGSLYLVHVRPPISRPIVPDGDAPPRPTGDGYPPELDDWFAQLVEELAAPRGVIVRPVALRGDPAEEILDFALRVRAELVAAGTQGPSLVHRIFVGSVSTALVRGARCAVLVAPAAA